MTGFLASQVSFRFWMALRQRDPNWQGTYVEDIHHAHGSKPITETRQETVFLQTKKGASHQTALAIAQAKRNEVLGEKKLLIGCGGGFQQESQQRYSPVKAWLATVHLALLDEAQQYGNIDELMTLARTAPYPFGSSHIGPSSC